MFFFYYHDIDSLEGRRNSINRTRQPFDLLFTIVYKNIGQFFIITSTKNFPSINFLDKDTI